VPGTDMLAAVLIHEWTHAAFRKNGHGESDACTWEADFIWRLYAAALAKLPPGRGQDRR